MKSGWRNDPAWVVLYEQRKRERLEREFKIKLLNLQLEKSKEAADESMRRLTILRPLEEQ